jgi:hypothetical protein
VGMRRLIFYTLHDKLKRTLVYNNVSENRTLDCNETIPSQNMDWDVIKSPQTLHSTTNE